MSYTAIIGGVLVTFQSREDCDKLWEYIKKTAENPVFSSYQAAHEYYLLNSRPNNQVNWLLRRIVKFRKKLVNSEAPVSLIRKYDKHFDII